MELLHRNPQDNTPVGSDDSEPEGEELDALLDFQHYHLPDLEGKGFIVYDRENHIITKGPNFEEIEPLLKLINRHSDELPDDWL